MKRVIVFIFLFILLTAQNQHLIIYLPIILKSYEPPPSIKKGYATVAFYRLEDDIELLRSSWYHTCSYNSIGIANGIYTPDPHFIVRLCNKEWLDSALQHPAWVQIQASGSGWIGGFNEPDRPEQANLTPTQAAVLWRQIEATWPEMQLLSPTPSIHNPGWLWRFAAEYQRLYGVKPKFDAISYNVYFRTAGEARAYLTARRVEALARGYDVPIWLTELGGECWLNDTGSAAMMNELVPWLESTEWIGRYAWFANRIENFCDTACWGNCTLVYDDGQLSPLGEVWRGQ